MRARMKFKKQGAMKFVGHLDVMRYFQKAFRRSGIDVAFTEGFSPHMILSFASPLGVGLTSSGEYADLGLKTPIASVEAVRRLNAVMAEGMEVLSFRRVEEGRANNAMALVDEADYTLHFRDGCAPPAGWEERFRAFYDAPSVCVTKTTKTSEKEIDIRPLIHSLRAQDGEVFLTLSAGSTDNVKPELVMEAFFRSVGFDLSPYALLINREELYAKGHIPLEALGEDIV